MMKGKMTLQRRLILPILLLGLVTLFSNLLAVFSINNVHANAGTIVDEYMVSEAKLEDIRRSMMDIHRLALSHIVAADHTTMIRLVQEIKAEEEALISCTICIMVAWSAATMWLRANRCRSMMERRISSSFASLTIYSSTMVPALAWTLLMLNTAKRFESKITSPSRAMGRTKRRCSVSLPFIHMPPKTG